MQDLVKNEADPVWECWLAHVAVLRFCLRHAYTRGVDGDRIDSLHQTFLEKFAAVPKWQTGYVKPKMHMVSDQASPDSHSDTHTAYRNAP